mmetsp:Transcript_158/g.479  ORF Transcript_158/g.479 Transcript_158/m.479 type:complete len:217 (+) Transcript_158:1099-1749(+)
MNLANVQERMPVAQERDAVFDPVLRGVLEHLLVAAEDAEQLLHPCRGAVVVRPAPCPQLLVPDQLLHLLQPPVPHLHKDVLSRVAGDSGEVLQENARGLYEVDLRLHSLLPSAPSLPCAVQLQQIPHRLRPSQSRRRVHAQPKGRTMLRAHVWRVLHLAVQLRGAEVCRTPVRLAVYSQPVPVIPRYQLLRHCTLRCIPFQEKQLNQLPHRSIQPH